ncbi:hypothetical protein GCM10027289_27770 [Tsukamurella serpentis]
MSAKSLRPEAPLATSRQVADHLGVDIETLANWRYLGKGPVFVKVGGAVRYDWADVATWIAGQKCQRTDVKAAS